MFSYEAGDLVISYRLDERMTESRGIVLEGQVVRQGIEVAKVIWKILPEYVSFFEVDGIDREPVKSDGYSIEWERVETLGLVCKLTTEELLIHGHPVVQAIGKQRFRDESSDR